MNNSFIENVNYVANLDNKFGSIALIEKNNLSLRNETFTGIFTLKYYDKSDSLLHEIKHESLGFTHESFNTELSLFSDQINNDTNGAFVSTYSSETIDFVINNIIDFNINVESSSDNIKLYEIRIEINSSTDGKIYDIVGEIKNSMMLLPKLAMISDEALLGAEVIGQNIDSVNTVADNIDNVVNVGESVDSVNTVSGNIGDVNTVSGINSDVSNVSSISTDVANVSSISGDVTVVSDNINSVNNVSSNVESIVSAVGISGSINVVALNIDSINTDANNIGSIKTVADDLSYAGFSNIDDMGSILDPVEVYPSGTSLIETVANNIDEVSAVSASIDAVIVNAQNIVDIQNAEENATIATTQATIATEKASEALVSANSASASEIVSTDKANITIAKASEALASASEALASENASKISETNAGVSENNALASANNASTSEANTLLSANSASDSAAVATTKASESIVSAANALASENSALDSKNSALSSASTATIKANEALSSADVATTQAGIATTKALEASVSASNASESAITATTKASQANLSASSASVSAGAASASAEYASTKSGEASASASNALTYANAASASAVSSSTSSEEAYASATNALASANSASSSASTASTKASEASASASSALSSENISTTKASEASTFATNASNSATSASNSASAASISETNAGNSEDVAIAKAGEALISANNASASEVNSLSYKNSASTSAITATTQASIATTKASEAVASATSALNSKDKSEKWAEELEDVAVEPGKYSAMHWAAKAQAFSQGNAIAINYNNSLSGLTATNVQSAIDELAVNTAGIHDAANITTGILDDARLPDSINSNITGNSATATKWATSRTIALSGDITGSADIDGSENVTITTSVAANSVALGIDTTGNYVAGLTQGTGITVSGTAGEGWSPTVALTNVGTAGTYRSVTTDEQGRVIEGSNPTTVGGYGITNVYTKTEVQTALPKVGLDTTNVAIPSEGQIAWNADEGTADLGLAGGSVLQIGQENTRTVRNDTASTIENGTVVMFAGTIGNSGRIKVAPYTGIKGTHNHIYGIATQTITPGSDGLITIDGKVRGINTTGASVGEVWADEDILYAKPNDNGRLTNVEPEDDEIKIVVASVIKAHANGTLEVRVLPIDENLSYTKEQSDTIFVPLEKDFILDLGGL